MINVSLHKWLLLVPIIVLLLTGTCGGLHAAAVSKEVTIVKTYEHHQDAALLELVLEGGDGPFASVLKLPGGLQLKASRSTKLIDGARDYWVNAYVIKKPPKGTYTFTITAPKQSYYHFKVNAPLFADIHKHWAEATINAFVEKGIAAGYGNERFGPNDKVTGEALVKMLVLSLTEEQPGGKRQWTKAFRWHVKNEALSKEMGLAEFEFSAGAGKGESWSVPYANAAETLGIMKEWPQAKLAEAFSRKDVALLLANVLSLVAPAAPSKPQAFSDIGKLEPVYRASIAKVSNYSIFNGYADGTFRPGSMVTRAEAVTALAKLVHLINS